MDARVLPLGDTAFTVEFGDRIAPERLAAVQALDLALENLHAAGRLPGRVECVPAFRSLTLIYDPLATSAAALQATKGTGKQGEKNMTDGTRATLAPVMSRKTAGCNTREPSSQERRLSST